MPGPSVSSASVNSFVETEDICNFGVHYSARAFGKSVMSFRAVIVEQREKQNYTPGEPYADVKKYVVESPIYLDFKNGHFFGKQQILRKSEETCYNWDKSLETTVRYEVVFEDGSKQIQENERISFSGREVHLSQDPRKIESLRQEASQSFEHMNDVDKTRAQCFVFRNGLGCY